MAEKKQAKAAVKTKKSESGNDRGHFSAEERAAMTERAQERKAAKRRGSKKADGEADVLAKIAEMEEPDRSMAERLHACVKAGVPELASRTWYGMPAYAKDGAVLCFFQGAKKFSTRYSTLGFSDKANLDDGGMWPTSFAIPEWTDDVEAHVLQLVKRAAS